MKKMIALICSIILCMTAVTPVSAASIPDASEYLESKSSAVLLLRKELIHRNPNLVIRIHVQSNSMPDMESFMDDIFEQACEHTGVSYEGDALRWNWKLWNCDANYQYIGNDYYITYQYHIDYYITQMQEEALQAAIQSLKSKLDLDGKSDQDIVKGIYDYICANVKYDYSTNGASNEIHFTAYSALIHQKAVCQGYAELFYRLCLEYGIDCRIISGQSMGQLHGWNIVKIDGKYYCADTTWDAQKLQYRYFLKGSDTFNNDHITSSEYLTSSFTSAYPIAKDDYHTGVNAPQGSESQDVEISNVAKVGQVTLKKDTYTYNGKVKSPTIIVKDTDGKKLKKGTDYTVSMPKGRKNVGKYTYTVKFKGNYSGSKKLTLTIKPSKPTIKVPKIEKKAVTVKWKKVSKQATGYQVMIATNKKFTKGVKKSFVTKTATASKKFTKLQSKKTYYVKVRTYKTVKVKGKNTKIYSDWSAMKPCKTK